MNNASPEPSEAEIQKVAYRLYLESGCEHGHDVEHWFAAREFLRHHHGRPPANRTQRKSPPRNRAASVPAAAFKR